MSLIFARKASRAPTGGGSTPPRIETARLPAIFRAVSITPRKAIDAIAYLVETPHRESRTAATACSLTPRNDSILGRGPRPLRRVVRFRDPGDSAPTSAGRHRDRRRRQHTSSPYVCFSPPWWAPPGPCTAYSRNGLFAELSGNVALMRSERAIANQAAVRRFMRDSSAPLPSPI